MRGGQFIIACLQVGVRLESCQLRKETNSKDFGGSSPVQREFVFEGVFVGFGRCTPKSTRQQRIWGDGEGGITPVYTSNGYGHAFLGRIYRRAVGSCEQSLNSELIAVEAVISTTVRLIEKSEGVGGRRPIRILLGASPVAARVELWVYSK